MAASSIIMIQPTNFYGNPETINDNAFQKGYGDSSEVQAEALAEFNRMVENLQSVSIDVNVFSDLENSVSPDSIFPNNWFSTHLDGKVVIYPMKNENRRRERRKDVIDQLVKDRSQLIDLSELELNGQYLEGTGSVVLDHENKVAYICRSERSDEQASRQLAESLDFKICLFDALYNGKPIYHTNVMMSVGENWIIGCLEAITEETKENFLSYINNSGKRFIEISIEQMESFLGNCIELKNKEGEKFLILSATALKVLNDDQKELIEKFDSFLPIEIPVIEKNGGGSVRCMIAENYLIND